MWGLRFCQCVEISRGGGSTRQPQRTEPSQCVNGQPWACQGALQVQMQALQCEAGVVGPALGAAAGLGKWFVGVAVLPVCGDFQRKRQQPATTSYRALPVCKCPALGIPWGTARSNAASTLQCAAGVVGPTLGAAAERVVCGGCGFASLWRFPEEEAALGNHSTQSQASG